MKNILYILILFAIPCNGQMLINSFIVGTGGGGGGGSYPTTNLLFAQFGDAGVTQSSNNVSSWADQSGNSRNLTQATGSSQPDWNGSDAISFNGTSDYLSMSYTIAQSATIYIVMKINSTGADKYIYGNVASNFFVWGNSNSEYTINNNSGGNSITTGGTFNSTSTYYLICAKINGASSSISINGNAAVTGTLAAGSFTNPFLLGAVGLSGSPFQYAGITVKAILGYGTQTTQEVTDTKEFLRVKYSLY